MKSAEEAREQSTRIRTNALNERFNSVSAEIEKRIDAAVECGNLYVAIKCYDTTVHNLIVQHMEELGYDCSISDNDTVINISWASE